MSSPAPGWERSRSDGEDQRLRADLANEFQQNNADLFSLDLPDLAVLWAETKRQEGWSDARIAERFRELTGFALAQAATYGAAVTDTQVMLNLARDLHRSGSIFGTYRTEVHKGRRYVIFRGRPGLRRVLTAPRYLETNPKVVRMGVGREAARTMARSGFLLTVVLSATAHTVHWLLNDEATIHYVLGNVATDVVKSAISTAAGYLAAAGAAVLMGGGVVAVVPIAAGIAVGLAVGFALNRLDEHFGLTQRLVEALASSHNQWRADLDRTRREFNYYFGTPEGAIEFMRRLSGSGAW